MITSNLTREFIISAISARVWAQISFRNVLFYTLLTLLSSHQWSHKDVKNRQFNIWYFKQSKIVRNMTRWHRCPGLGCSSVFRNRQPCLQPTSRTWYSVMAALSARFLTNILCTQKYLMTVGLSAVTRSESSGSGASTGLLRTKQMSSCDKWPQIRARHWTRPSPGTSHAAIKLY